VKSAAGSVGEETGNQSVHVNKVRHRESDMSGDEIRMRIKEAVSRIAGIAIDQIADDARFVEDLGLDSLSIIESLVVVEHEFRLQPEEEDMGTNVRSIEDAVQLVQGQLVRKAG
jgi:acyl carrier protein